MLTQNEKDALHKIAVAMVRPGQGILAADESTGTIKKRFDSINTESTEDKRRDWREMLFRTVDAMKENISGVILYDETLRQKAKDGTALVKLIQEADSLPGIKVDMGTVPLAGHPKELVTQGLDGLRERLEEYYKLGARFAKWRGVFEIEYPGEEFKRPSQGAMLANCHALARYAALCQEAGIVPIVEPEVLMGGHHTIERCEKVTRDILVMLFEQLHRQGVWLPGTILKPNMVVPGKQCPKQASVQEVAEATLRVLTDCVPVSVPGIAFLSGGQENEIATEHLDAMNKIGGFPWALTYSYGRALQQSALFAWQGKAENYDAAQAAFRHRAKMNGAAALGEYDKAAE